MSEASWVYIAAPVAAWLLAQAIKVGVAASKGNKDLGVFFQSGNMPSSHTAITLALLTVLAVRVGFDSALFGTAAIFTAIIIYDAVNVRRAVGEQGEVLKSLVKLSDKKATFYTAHGHRLEDVAVGAAIGIGCAFAVLQIL